MDASLAHSLTLDPGAAAALDTSEEARRTTLLEVARACAREDLLDGVEVTADGTDALLVPMWRTRRLLVLSPVGRQYVRRYHDLASVVVVEGDRHRPVVDATDLLGLYREELEGRIEGWLWDRLLSEVQNSEANFDALVADRRGWDAELRRQARDAGGPTFWSGMRKRLGREHLGLFFEQWGARGHPYHPCRKSKMGFSPEELRRYAPEFRGRARLRWVALAREVANAEDGRGPAEPMPFLTAHFPAAMADWEASLRRRGLDPGRYLPLPVHPWQEEHKVRSLFADEIAREQLVLCDATVEAAATMSMRTLAPLASPLLPHIKLPIAIQATSMPRTLGIDRALFGPRASRLLADVLADDPVLARTVGILPELLAMHFAGAGADERGRHLSTMLRASPLSMVGDGEVPIVVGALLCPSPVTGEPVIAEIIEEAGARTVAQRLDYLRGYVGLVLGGPLRMYLRHGMAVEGHQQNTLLVFDEANRPARMLFRDLADLKIHEPTLRRAGRHVVSPGGPALHPLSSDPAYARGQLLFTVFQQHLGELFALLTRRWGWDERDLWVMVRAEVEAALAEHRDFLGEAWERERAAFLEEPWVERALLRMRLAPTLDAIITPIGNALAVAGPR